MNPLRQLVEELRTRSDIAVADDAQAWRVLITKGQYFLCEVTIPHDVLEWSASVRYRPDNKEVWSDWMDYSDYDDRPRDETEVEMAGDILAFIDRASTQDELPSRIYEDEGEA